MKVALVIQDLYRLGAQYVTALVAKGLAQRGHQVEVVVSAVHDHMGRERPDLQPFPLPDSVRLVRLPHLRSSRNAVALARYLVKFKPDVVMPMSGAYEITCAVSRLLARQGRSTRIITVVHAGGIGMPAEKSKVSGKREIGLAAFISKWVAGSSDKVIAVSRGTADALTRSAGYNACKICVIYNPVIDDVFASKRAATASHPWLKDKSAPVIVAAGAHAPVKGYDVLLRAFASVRQLRECRLILFGEGTLTETYRQLAETLGVGDFVSLPGYADNLPAELKAADLFVVSSHCESFSIVLVEALACGVPVVATNCPSGPTEILQNGRFGLLVQPDNLNTLAEGILKVLDGQGIVPPPESWEPYRLDRVIDQYEAVLRECIG